MLFLVDEMFKQKGKNISVKIGEPIPFNTFDRSRTPLLWASWLKAKVYQLESK
jgi:hypothetical protein